MLWYSFEEPCYEAKLYLPRKTFENSTDYIPWNTSSIKYKHSNMTVCNITIYWECCIVKLIKGQIQQL